MNKRESQQGVPPLRATSGARVNADVGDKPMNILALVISLLLFAIPQIATAAGTAPGVVTQGEFAGMLDTFLTQATDTNEYARIESEFAYTNLTPDRISTAIEHLTLIGLYPSDGWEADQPIRAHDMTSLIVRLHEAADRVNISDKDECMAYTLSVGCSISTISKVLKHIWENRPQQGVAGYPPQGVGSPER